MTKKTRYQILIAKAWENVTLGVMQPSGWLHWEIHTREHNQRSVNIGLAQPGKWRVKSKNED